MIPRVPNVPGVAAPRAGSHTFRHTCVQRLVDADVPFKVIGDYVGHRSADSTQVYGKVAVHLLRQLALGDGAGVSVAATLGLDSNRPASAAARSAVSCMLLLDSTAISVLFKV